MRVVRYLLIIAGILALLAATAWYLRDGLIQRLSNPALERYGISITDVSLDALAGDGASIGYLELIHDSGTTIAIDDLRLPIGKTPDGKKVYSAGTVTVSMPTRRAETPADYASILDRILALPDDLADIELRIAEFEVPPFPAIHDLRWALSDNEQSLRAIADTVAIAANLVERDSNRHDVTITLPGAVRATLDRQDAGFVIAGSSRVDLPVFGPALELSGIVPDAVRIEAGSAELDFRVAIPYERTQVPSATVQLSPVSPVHLTYLHQSGELTSIVLESGSAVEFSATFPDVDWSLDQAEASLLVSHGEWRNIPLRISRLSCDARPVCAMDTSMAMAATTLPVGAVAGVSFEGNNQVRFSDEGLRVNVRPGATLQVLGFAAPDIDVARIQATLESDAWLDTQDTGWSLSAGSVAGRIEAATLPGDVALGGAFHLDDLTFVELDGKADAELQLSASRMKAHRDDHVIDVPGVSGELSLHDGRVRADLATRGRQQGGVISARHDRASGAGRLDVSEFTFSFLDRKLSERIAPWGYDWDLAAGTVTTSAEASWRVSDEGTAFDGRGSAQISDLAGYYGDTAFAGLSTTLDVKYQDTSGFDTEPSSAALRLLEIGVPVENVRADYRLDLKNMSVDVDGLRMQALGGTVSADPFSFHTRKDANTVTLRAESIDLAALLSLKEFEAIEVSGRVAAELPVTIAAGSITISAGTLTGELPGGAIRYLPGLQQDEAEVSSIGLAARALSNFEYETLTSDVDYSDKGDLVLKLRISGRNPDMDGGRPVVLNLNVENNVPQLLRSLRAARDVEDILQQRIER